MSLRRLQPVRVVNLRGGSAMQQAPLFDGLPFGPFSLDEDGLAAPEIDVGRAKLSRLSW